MALTLVRCKNSLVESADINKLVLNVGSLRRRLVLEFDTADGVNRVDDSNLKLFPTFLFRKRLTRVSFQEPLSRVVQSVVVLFIFLWDVINFVRLLINSWLLPGIIWIFKGWRRHFVGLQELVDEELVLLVHLVESRLVFRRNNPLHGWTQGTCRRLKQLGLIIKQESLDHRILFQPFWIHSRYFNFDLLVLHRIRRLHGAYALLRPG